MRGYVAKSVVLLKLLGPSDDAKFQKLSWYELKMVTASV